MYFEKHANWDVQLHTFGIVRDLIHKAGISPAPSPGPREKKPLMHEG